MPAISAENQEKFQKVINAGYAKSLGIELADLRPESLTLKLPLACEKHNNAAGVVHGGVIMSLADTAMGCACFNLGHTVVTMDLNINFIKSARPEGSLKAIASVIHSGSRTLVVEAEIYDGNGVFLAKSRGTFFVNGKVEDFKPATS